MRIPRVALVVLGLGACLPDLPPDVAQTTTASCGDGVVDLAREACDPGPTSAAGCTAQCTIDCEGTVVPSTGHCYFARGVARSFSEAAARCRGNAAHVVTVGGAGELSVTRSLATAPVWVDLTRSGAAGAYVTSSRDEPGAPIPPTTGPCSGCFAPGADDAGALPPLDPSAPVADCVVLAGDAFAVTTCASTAEDLAVVCEREPPGDTTTTCTDGLCTALREAPKTLVTLVNAVSFETAEARCGVLGGRLWIPSGTEERLAAAHALTAVFGTSARVWMGLSLVGPTWTWKDNTTEAARAVPWGDRQPSVTSGAAAAFVLEPGAYDTGLLRALPQAEANPVVCEVPRAK